jgi:hypothetical protein
MKSLSDKLKKIIEKPFVAFPKNSIKLTLMFSLPFVVIFILLFISLMLWERKSHKQDLIIELRETARAYFEQILITRLWNAQHGGVYVEVTDRTQPNPYLKDDPERDITTVDGKKYTKINPAFMTRQISELAHQKGRYKFHITSLKPINPQNRADEWETRQLDLFESGKKQEAYEVVKDDGGERFRYMAPLFIESSCLACHQKYGYKLDNLRGGISIDIPLELRRNIHMTMARRSIFAFGIIGIISLSFIIGTTWLLSKKIVLSIEKEMEYERLKTAIQLAGATAHELRQPMTIIVGIAELLDDKISKKESVKQEIDIIIQQCYRMDEIIKKMLHITQYKTKTYSGDVEIFDLEGQQKKIDL